MIAFTLNEWEPATIRWQALDRLRESVSAEVLFLDLASVDGTHIYHGMQGSAGLRDEVARFDGRPVHRDGITRSTEFRRWNARAPETLRRNRFLTLDDDYGGLDALAEQSMQAASKHDYKGLFEDFYLPSEISAQTRALMYADGEFLGFISALRQGGDVFRKDELAEIRSLTGELHRMLLLARAAERASNTGPIHLIVDETGHPLYADERARAWLTPRRIEQLKRLNVAGRPRPIDGMVPLSGWLDDGHRRLSHVALTPVRPVQLSQWSHFSATQRSIVELALSGMSNREIARLEGISPSTVKYHLTQACLQLDVTGRQGLLKKVGGAGGGP